MLTDIASTSGDLQTRATLERPSQLRVVSFDATPYTDKNTKMIFQPWKQKLTKDPKEFQIAWLGLVDWE
jgi:hypothetical protein